MRTVVVALAGAMLVGAGSPAAAAAPVPATLDPQGIDAWRRAHIEGEGWTLMHADGAALSYARAGGPDGLRPDQNGVLRIDVRREYYRPVRLGPQDWYILGDNRDDASDSRIWGPFENKDICAVATVILQAKDKKRVGAKP